MQTYNNPVWAFHIESGVAPPGNPLFFIATLLYKCFCNNWLTGALNMKLSPVKYMSRLHVLHLQVLCDRGCCLTHSLPLLVCRPTWPRIFRPWKQASQSLMAPLNTEAGVVAELARAFRVGGGDECYLWQDSRGTFSQVCIENRGRGDKMQKRADQQIYAANSSALVFLDIAKEPRVSEGEERKLIKTGRLFSFFGHNCPHREIPGCLWEAVWSQQ